MAWTSFGWVDLPAELEAETGETIAEWNTRIAVYAAAHPGTLKFATAANLELALKHAYDKAVADAPGAAPANGSITAAKLGPGTPAAGKYFDGAAGWTTLPDPAQSGSRDWIDVLAGAPLWMFGDSEFTASSGDYLIGQWLVNRNNMASYTSRAAAGATAGQVLEQIRGLSGGAGAALTGFAVVDPGINNVTSSHTTATVREAYRAIFANLTFKARETYAASSFNFGSGWTNGVTATPGSRVNRKWTGDTNYVSMKFTTGADVTWSVKTTDGTTLETFNTGGFSEEFAGVHKLSGFGAGDHEVTITLESGAGGTIYGALIPNPDPMTVFWIAVGDVAAFNSGQNTLLTSTYRAAIAGLIADFPTVVQVLPTGWNPTTMVVSDLVHWNVLGVAFWIERIEAEARLLSYRQGQNAITTNAIPSYTVPTASAPGGATAPGQVTGLSVTPGNAQAALSWTAPASNGGSSITDYTLEYRVTSVGGAWTAFAHTAGTATSRTITGLTNSTGYDFRVSAVNAIGTGTPSSTQTGTPSSSATAPGQVTGLSLTPGNAQLAASWTAPSNGGSAITDYKVEIRNPGGSGSYTIFSDGTSTSTSATITGLTNGTSVDVRVSAINAVGTGTASSAVSGTPAASFDFSAYTNYAGDWEGDALPGANNSTLAAWPDASPADLDLTTTGSPVVKTGGPNGSKFVRFTRAGGQHAISPTRTRPTEFTYFVVMAITGTTSQFVFTGSSGQTLISGYKAGTVEGFQNPRQDVGAWTDGEFAIFEYVHPANGGTAIGLKNGTQTSTGSPTTSLGAGSSAVELGVGTDPVDADFVRMLQYESALNSSDRSAIRAALGAKYGITVV